MSRRHARQNFSRLAAMHGWLFSLACLILIPMPILTLSHPLLAQRQCDAAYPDVCIPSPPPDLDCADIPHRRFRVLAPDPHRFDGDKDGIGCER